MAKKQRSSRNPVARHLFIHRGGVHEKSNSAKRQENKRQLRKLVDKAGAGFSGPYFLPGHSLIQNAYSPAITQITPNQIKFNF